MAEQRDNGRPLVLDILRESRYGKIDRHGFTRTVPMKILCLGLSRTGTSSLRQALFDLGYDDIYHQTSINVDSPRDAEHWVTALHAKFEGQGAPFTIKQWDSLLGHCMAVSDVPCVTFWKELMDAYPEAKILLTVRDSEEDWYHSFMRSSIRLLGNLYGPRWLSWVRALAISEGQNDKFAKLLLKYDESYSACFQDYVKGTQNGVAVYSRHNEAVQQYAAAQGRRVLIFNVKEGWKPLCEFLDVDMPDTSFPHLNDAEYFQQGSSKLFALVAVAVGGKLLLALTAIGLALWLLYRP